ncbi:hypothetical protein E4U58_005214 [Claviceps cyperi]|nr:hypothetical protein E4U58_005214 [Claviceps cyperi]
MRNSSKTIVATGLSSGLVRHTRFAARPLFIPTTNPSLTPLFRPFRVSLGTRGPPKLLDSEEPHTNIFGARNTEAIKRLNFDRLLHTVVALPLELNNLSEVKTFSEQALEDA